MLLKRNGANTESCCISETNVILHINMERSVQEQQIVELFDCLPAQIYSR